MLRRLAVIVAAVLAAACASSHVTTVDVGPELASDIRSALSDGELRSVILVDGERAFWIGTRALPLETTAFTEALLAASTSRELRGAVSGFVDVQVLRFDPNTVLAFRQPVSSLEFSLLLDDEMRVVRVIRVPTADSYRYDVQMSRELDADATLAQRLEGSAALDTAWTNLTSSAAAASPEVTPGSHRLLSTERVRYVGH